MRYIGAVLFAVGVASSASKPPPENSEILLQKIRRHTAAYLTQLPKYTCHEVMNRLLRRGSTWTPLDTVEIEVAFIGKEELYARPGEDHFTERVIDRVIPHGTVGNGAFGTHVEIIISDNMADFKYARTGKKDGHQTFRYDFSVPLERSQFLIKHGGTQALVPYEGSIWVDVDTLDLVRVDLHVKHIGPHVGVRGIEEVIHYQVMHFGNTDALLPRKSELGATDDAGNYTLNLVELQSCREFKSDSIVQYGTPKEGSAARERQDQ